MLYLLYAIFFISCIVLVATVLLQPGKTDAGALFTSNISSTAFGPRGTASVLSKVTIAAATVFMLSALLISMPVFSGEASVLQGAGIETPADETPAGQPQTAQPATAPATSDASTQTNTNGALIETPATKDFKTEVNANASANANK